MIKQDWQQFRSIFLKKCCKLVCEAKPTDKPKYLTDKKYKNKKAENLITYEYVKNMKQKSYQENIAISCGSDEKRGSNLDDLVNPDITFSTLDNRLKTFFECKILGANSKYIKEGIQRFVAEKYGFRNMPFYGMLGYIKDGNSATEKHKKLEQSISKKQSELNLMKKEIIENSEVQVIFKTKHKTIDEECNINIEITHILHFWKSSLAIV